MRNSHPSPPSRESAHHQQLVSLLQVVQTLEPFILPPVVEIGVTPPEPDSRAAAAAVATFTRACGKLDELLADGARWTLAGHDDLYASMVATQEQQRAFLKAQTEAAEGLRRPSFQLRPTLATCDGGFIAIWGDFTVPGGYIVGRGATPAAAMLDFDVAFTRTPDEQVKIIADAEENPPEPPEPTTPTRKKKR